MANPNGRKGSGFERLVADYWRDHWSEFIDRRVKTGAKDKGDIANVRVGPHRVVVECKNSVSYKDLSGWCNEAAEEAINDNALCGIVVHKRARYGKPEDQYVTMTQGTLLKLLRVALSAGTDTL